MPKSKEVITLRKKAEHKEEQVRININFDKTKKLEFMTPTEVARLLGVSRPTIYNWMKSGKLKCFKIGGLYKVSKEDFEEFLIQSVNLP